MCDKSYLLSCVPDAGLSKAEYDQIVGDGNEVILSPDSIDNSAMSDNADDFEF